MLKVSLVDINLKSPQNSGNELCLFKITVLANLQVYFIFLILLNVLVLVAQGLQ